ncbi:MAG: glycosyltransferase [Planctomycetota bacterium]|jgi:cellulose synthase/poly-beta-1,6-N-acetylglucosamine synthase-like glycosyltransferase
MDFYYYIALAAIASQLLLLIQTYKNYRFALHKHKRDQFWYTPATVLIVPCKGLDSAFEENISSFYRQEYENYLLWFVVGEEWDPAYAELCRLRDRFAAGSKSKEVQIFVAGPGQSRSQKIHNLLHCYEKLPDDVEVMAFADSDTCVRSAWLSNIVHPLRSDKNGVASGYRWFVPNSNNLASLALSAMNAKVAQLLGNTRFNQAWGGSMAIRVDVFRNLGLDKIWPKALSDDLSLSTAVKKAGMKVAFVPACLVASYESTAWAELFEFGRRQFLITRVYAPRTWWFGLFSALYSVLGIWATAALAIYAATIGHEHVNLFASVPVVFFANQLGRAVMRQAMAAKLLGHDREAMRASSAADILACWLWSLLLLLFIVSSAFGRTICWRGIRYKLLSPTEIVVEKSDRS